MMEFSVETKMTIEFIRAYLLLVKEKKQNNDENPDDEYYIGFAAAIDEINIVFEKYTQQK